MLLAFLFDDQREWSIAVSQQQHTTGDEKTFPRCPPDGGCQRWAPIERVCFLSYWSTPRIRQLFLASEEPVKISGWQQFDGNSSGTASSTLLRRWVVEIEYICFSVCWPRCASTVSDGKARLKQFVKGAPKEPYFRVELLGCACLSFPASRFGSRKCNIIHPFLGHPWRGFMYSTFPFASGAIRFRQRRRHWLTLGAENNPLITLIAKPWASWHIHTRAKSVITFFASSETLSLSCSGVRLFDWICFLYFFATTLLVWFTPKNW